MIAVADEIREEEVMACIVAADGLAGATPGSLKNF